MWAYAELETRRVACRHAVITDRRSSNLFCMSLKEYSNFPLEEFWKFYH